MLLDCYLPVFKQVLQMVNNPERFEDYQQSRQTCLSLLEQAIHETKELDVREEEKVTAQEAVISWLDETVLRSHLLWRHHWQCELLQRKYLNTTVAGERFFTLLNQLGADQNQVREVFLFCLQLGFQGQYASPDDQSVLQNVIAEQRRMCLSEAWQFWPNQEPVVPSHSTVPGPVRQRPGFLLIMTGIMLLYIILYIFFSAYVS